MILFQLRYLKIRMYTQQTLIVYTLICALLPTAQAWWPFSSSSSEETGTEQGKYLQNSPVPFEMTTAEEKFLAEAKKYMGDLSPLDSCHQIVSIRQKRNMEGCSRYSMDILILRCKTFFNFDFGKNILKLVCIAVFFFTFPIPLSCSNGP